MCPGRWDHVLASIWNEKPRVDWEKLTPVVLEWGALLSTTTTIRRFLRHAISKACHDPSVPRTLFTKILQWQKKLNKNDDDNDKDAITNDLEEWMDWTLSAIRCHNMTAVQVLVTENKELLNSNVSSDACSNSNGILHLACKEFGWNDEIAWILKATLEEHNHNVSDDDYSSTCYGLLVLFECNAQCETPLRLAVQAGASLHTIIQHLQRHHPVYWQQQVCSTTTSVIMTQLVPLVAEYCDGHELELLWESRVMEPAWQWRDPHQKAARQHNNNHNFRNSHDGCAAACARPTMSPLQSACFYQNKAMIQRLLDFYHDQKATTSKKKNQSARKLLWNRLTSKQKEYNSDQALPPLALLVRGLGRMDAGNAFDCVDVCMEYIPDLPIIHYAIETLLLLEEEDSTPKTCLQAVRRIMERFQVDLCALDYSKRSVLSILISVITSSDTVASSIQKEEGIAVMEYLLSECPQIVLVRDSKRRLSLHVACEQGLKWDQGLRSLLHANNSMCTLKEIDPKTNLLPFALSATASSSDLGTIYNLLRYDPSGITHTLHMLSERK